MFNLLNDKNSRRFEAKLGNMRKPQEFILYPRKDGELYTIQSDKSIGQFDETGKGNLNTKGCYFVHLSSIAGAIEFQFPNEVVEFCKNLCKKDTNVTNK